MGIVNCELQKELNATNGQCGLNLAGDAIGNQGGSERRYYPPGERLQQAAKAGFS